MFRALSTSFTFSDDYNEMLQFLCLLLVLIFVFVDKIEKWNKNIYRTYFAW